MADRKGLKDELQDQSPDPYPIKKVMSNSICSYEIANELVIWIEVHIRAKSKTSIFATDGIWVTFSVVLNFLLLGWTPWMGFENERPVCFHNRQKWHGHSWACCYSNTVCKCDGRNRLFHSFPSVAFWRLCCHSNVLNCGSIFSLSYWSLLVAL